ncbi:uncharacterized protein N7484_000052 [Penicillium longicatenatum]|uniref:uncharacterized protein n=1 Tax=Penicillium longicatenatum TaxID=1561947 RepID=UPI002547A6A2|nr:uncharacterized protein N7484_000052 [Penicillium longicatenatum]KAJ5660680.1 hypothetical protein N7484_000052 [Penicillium longicatenatum]
MQAADGYHCEQCNATFQRKEHYQRHRRTHTKEKPFSCTECGQSFARIDSLTRHYGTRHRQGASESSGERRRVIQACKPCNLSKLRCDGQRPCERCRRYEDECYYEDRQKRRMTDRNLSPTLPHSKRHHPQTPALSSTGLTHSSYPGDPSQSTTNPSPPLTIVNQVAAVRAECVPPSHEPANMPDLNGYAMESADQVPTQGSTLNNEGLSDLKYPRWGSLLDLDLDIGEGLDPSIWPNILDPRSSLDHFDNIWLASTEPTTGPIPAPETPQIPTPLTTATVGEIYNRACSPGPTDEAVEPRQYQPTAIEIDAQLTFPDMQHIRTEDVDKEHLAHIHEIQQNVVDEVAKLASVLESKSLFPPFVKLKIPPAPIINAWTQLYFEHFHPVFPVLHKPTFGGPDTHWLLVFAVSAIGAQFSRIPQAQTCARAMHELIRRQSMYLVILLNQIGLMYSGERRALEIAELLQALPVTLARRKHLFTNILSAPKMAGLDLSLSQRWQIWALDEERRRTGFAIWLVDSAFQSHFDLTPVLSVGELQNSLPHGEERWAASGARGWASFSTHTESSTLHTVEQVVRDSTWMASWIKTGILGKQTLLQLLSNAAVIDQDRLLSSQSHNGISQIEAEAALKALLAGTEDEESNVSALELKASISHRLVILSVLMLRNTPRLPLLATAMRVRYRRYTDEELRSLATEWNKAPQERRRAAIYAARAFESVRSQYCAHFSTPVLLFRATLIIWLFTVLDDLSLDSQPASDAPLIILGASNTTDPNQEQWVESGNGRVKLQGVGNIFSSLGRQRFLDESISAMQSLRSWGISKIYRQLLTQLRAD